MNTGLPFPRLQHPRFSSLATIVLPSSLIFFFLYSIFLLCAEAGPGRAQSSASPHRYTPSPPIASPPMGPLPVVGFGISSLAMRSAKREVSPPPQSQPQQPATPTSGLVVTIRGPLQSQRIVVAEANGSESGDNAPAAGAWLPTPILTFRPDGNPPATVAGPAATTTPATATVAATTGPQPPTPPQDGVEALVASSERTTRARSRSVHAWEGSAAAPLRKPPTTAPSLAGPGMVERAAVTTATSTPPEANASSTRGGASRESSTDDNNRGTANTAVSTPPLRPTEVPRALVPGANAAAVPAPPPGNLLIHIIAAIRSRNNRVRKAQRAHSTSSDEQSTSEERLGTAPHCLLQSEW